MVRTRSPVTQPGARESQQPPKRVPWSVLGPEFIRRWGRPEGKNMPEHLEILGPNGSGKTHFQDQVLMDRARVRGTNIVLLSTKQDDKTLLQLKYPDGKPWKTITKWPPPYGVEQVIYAARMHGLAGAGRAKQRASIMSLFNHIYVPNTNRLLVLDEIGYLQQELRLGTTLNTMYREGRALGLGLVSNTQRPVGTTRYMHSESAWKVAFHPADEDDARRVAEIFGNRRRYLDYLMDLDATKFEFLLQYSKTGQSYISSM